MKKLTILIFLFSLQYSFTQDKRVLFLGNSYTYGNNLPNIVENLSTDGGHTVFVDSYTAGGQILEGHSDLATPQSKIKAGNWDVIILQEQSQIPTIPYYKKNLMYPSAHRLKDSIRKYNPCAAIMMFMTWGRRYGGQQCDSDGTYCSPAFTDFSHMQDSLASAYVRIADEIQAAVAPVGRAWEDIILNTSTVLHTGDNSHPNNNGSYLAACVFYAMIWKESPVGLAPQAGVDASLAPILQESAKKTVFEGSFDWNINIDSPQASFSYETIDQTIHFQNESISSDASNYHWDFGDGNTSDEENPSHIYTNAGNYTISLTVTQTECNREDSFSQELSISEPITSLDMDLEKSNFVLYPNPSRENLQIQSSLFLDTQYQISIIDSKGWVITQQLSQVQKTQSLELNSLIQGQYFVKIQELNTKKSIILNWIKVDR